MADSSGLRFLAFYLPQYHPIPENDLWWGPGFTEWANVVRARSLFRGHHQPHLPGELGFYDLRVPETRAAQAQLARDHGIDGFCYYHYWFEGKRLLQRPLDDVVRSGEPDFPFCLCWANENWTRAWNGGATDVIMQQRYSVDDDLRHARWLAEVLADRRYLCIGTRPLLLVYRAADLPDPRRTADCWRSELTRLGVDEPYLCAVGPLNGTTPAELGFDAAVQFAPNFKDLEPDGSTARRALRRFLRPRSPHRTNRVVRYSAMAESILNAPVAHYKRYPCVTPGFDNSPRRPKGGAFIVPDATPRRYEEWLSEAVSRFEPYSPEENLFFVNAWNEWAEGNHLEPCARWGRGFLSAHARVTSASRLPGAAETASMGAGDSATSTEVRR